MSGEVKPGNPLPPKDDNKPKLVSKENYQDLQKQYHINLEPIFDELRKYKLENIILHKDIKRIKDENVKL